MLDQNMSLLAVTPKTVNSLKQLNAQGLPPTDLSTIETPNPITQGIRNPQQTAQEETDDYNGMFKIVDTSTYDNNGNITKAEFGVVHGATFDREKKTSEDSIAHYIHDIKFPATFTDLTINTNYYVYLSLNTEELELSITDDQHEGNLVKGLGRITWRNYKPVIEQFHKDNVCVFKEPPPYHGSFAIVDTSTYDKKGEITHAEFAVVNTNYWNAETKTGGNNTTSCYSSDNYYNFTLSVGVFFSSTVFSETAYVRLLIDTLRRTGKIVVDTSEYDLDNAFPIGTVEVRKKRLIISQIYDGTELAVDRTNLTKFQLISVLNDTGREVWLTNGHDKKNKYAGICDVNGTFFVVPKQQITQIGRVYIAFKPDKNDTSKGEVSVVCIPLRDDIQTLQDMGYVCFEQIGEITEYDVVQHFIGNDIRLFYFREWCTITEEDE